jgi:putative Holliday junction resolvase
MTPPASQAVDQGDRKGVSPFDLLFAEGEEGRILALDYGHKRVGVAVSDPFRSFAMPDVTLPNTEALFDNILALIQEKSVVHVVVGLPLHMNGSDTEQTTLTRTFAKDLAAKNLSVSFWDERMSSRAVERQMLTQDASRRTRKANVDSQAAAFILQGFLDRLKSPGYRPILIKTPHLEDTHDDL